MGGKTVMGDSEELKNAVQENLKRLNGIYRGIDGNKRKLLDKQIQNAAYYEAKIDELKIIIVTSGMTEPTQSGTKKSSEVDVLASFQNAYSKITEVLERACPLKQKSSRLKNFIE